VAIRDTEPQGGRTLV